MKNKLRLLLAICFFSFTIQANAQWTPIAGNGDGFVVDFEIFNGELYATGFFKKLNGVDCNYIAKWDGSNWQAVGNGFEQAGHYLRVIDGELYGVRYENRIDSNWLYKFDGSNFNKFGTGVYLTTAGGGLSQNVDLYNIIQYNGRLIVSGEFDRVGSKPISGIMQWSGNDWDSLGAGLSGNVPNSAPVMYPHDMHVFGTDLIVCGNFGYAGGKVANGIARWDGTEWHAMGEGFNKSVYGICEYKGELYAGGDFTASGGTVLKYIAKWDGTKWIDPGFNFFYNNPAYYSFVHTLKVLDDKLIIAGGFDRASMGATRMRCTGIAAYDGTTIDTLAGGLAQKEVEAVALYNGDLIAGGGLNGSSYIARYSSVTSTGSSERQQAGLTIFPNPSSSVFHIESASVFDVVCVSDMLGRIIYESKTNGKQASFTLPDNGVYFVSIVSGADRITRRVIVSK